MTLVDLVPAKVVDRPVWRRYNCISSPRTNCWLFSGEMRE